MNKLKTYKTFEDHIIRDENYINLLHFKTNDVNYEEEIDNVLESLIQKKFLISMLGDTINHVCDKIEEVFPDPPSEFMSSLYHYEDDIYNRVQNIRENMIDGFPNIKEMIDEVENNIVEIEKYLKNKKK